MVILAKVSACIFGLESVNRSQEHGNKGLNAEEVRNKGHNTGKLY